MKLKVSKRGDEYTLELHNNIITKILKLLNIKGVIGSGISVKNIPNGFLIDNIFANKPFYYVKCTSENDPSAGLHTFKECDWEGTILIGDSERIFQNCKLIGDFNGDWDISDTVDSESFGILYIKKTKDGYSNQVLLLPYPGNAYYYE